MTLPVRFSLKLIFRDSESYLVEYRKMKLADEAGDRKESY